MDRDDRLGLLEACPQPGQLAGQALVVVRQRLVRIGLSAALYRRQALELAALALPAAGARCSGARSAVPRGAASRPDSGSAKAFKERSVSRVLGSCVGLSSSATDIAVALCASAAVCIPNCVQIRI